jgi:hypothetical protein
MRLIDTVPASLLHHRPFVLYWIARVFAAFAFQMVGVAVGWQIYALTGNALDLGLVGLVQFLPATVLILVAGQLADRYDRRAIPDLPGHRGPPPRHWPWARSAADRQGFILTTLFFLAPRAFDRPPTRRCCRRRCRGGLFPRAASPRRSRRQPSPVPRRLLYAVSPGVVYFLLARCSCRRSRANFVAVMTTERGSARPPVTFAVFFAGVAFIRRVTRSCSA